MAKIDSISFYGNPNCKPLIFKNIEPNQKIENYLKNCNKESGDGSYKITLYFKDTIISKGHGYFTNGTPIFNKIYIQVENKNDIKIWEE